MERAELEERAGKILLTNLRRGVADWNGKEFSFVVPSLTGYPFQWFWDSWFPCHCPDPSGQGAGQGRIDYLDERRPARRIYAPHHLLGDGQAARLPQPQHCRYDLALLQRYHSAAHPGLCGGTVFDATGDTAFRDAALPVLTAYYRWLRINRDPDDDGLIAVIQPEEAGTDCSPKYDEALGLEELSNQGFIAALRRVYAAYEPMRGDDRRILAADIFHLRMSWSTPSMPLGLRSLARLLGDAPEAEEFRREADKTRNALLSKCWDEEAGAFFDLCGVAETPVKVVTISSLMPLILDDLPRPIVERLVEQWITNPGHFWLPYPLPSVPASDPKFMPGNPRGFIWRGPTWVNTNWFLSHALRRHGYPELADTIKAKTHEAVEMSGFREYYQPYTGEGLGARDFGWTTLILDF